MLMCNKNGCYSENGYVAESVTLAEESDDEMILNKWNFSMSISAKSVLLGPQSMHNDGTHKESVYADTETLSSFVHSASVSLHENEDSNNLGTQSLSTVTETKLSIENASKGICPKKYKIVELLMAGSSSMVYVVQSDEPENSGQFYAMKIIPFVNELNEPLFWNECVHLSKLKDVPGVIQIENFFYDDNRGFIVTELASYDVFSTEANTQDARLIIRSLLNTVKHLHQKNIAHRDIKPENVVIFEREHLAAQAKTAQRQQGQMKEKKKNEEQKSWKAEKERQKPRGKHIEVKLIDFGNAVSGDNWYRSNEMIGTLNYMSPERYNPAQQQLWHEWTGDVWSIGVVTFELLFQQRLFEPDQEVHVLKAQICQGLWSFPTTNQSQLSMSDLEWLAAKHFINHLLVTDPTQRTTAAYALKHPWLCRSNKIGSIKQLRHRMHLWEKHITTYVSSAKKH